MPPNRRARWKLLQGAEDLLRPLHHLVFPSTTMQPLGSSILLLAIRRCAHVVRRMGVSVLLPAKVIPGPDAAVAVASH